MGMRIGSQWLEALFQSGLARPAPRALHDCDRARRSERAAKLPGRRLVRLDKSIARQRIVFWRTLLHGQLQHVDSVSMQRGLLLSERLERADAIHVPQLYVLSARVARANRVPDCRLLPVGRGRQLYCLPGGFVLQLDRHDGADRVHFRTILLGR